MNDYFNDPFKNEDTQSADPIDKAEQNNQSVNADNQSQNGIPQENAPVEPEKPVFADSEPVGNIPKQPTQEPPTYQTPYQPQQQQGYYQQQSGYPQQPNGYYQQQNYTPPKFSPQQPQYQYNDQYDNQPKKPKKSSKGIITFTILLVACVLVAAIAMIVTLNSDDALIGGGDNNTTTTSPAPSKVITPNDKPTTDEDKNDTVAGEISATAEVASKIAPSVVAITVDMGAFNQTAGSGFIISEDGYIVTNHHVVAEADSKNSRVKITVLLDDGNEYNAKFVAGDSRNDIAVIKIDATGLSPAEIGNSDQLLRGDFVMAVGNPLGEFQGSVSLGVVSGTGRVGIDSSSIPYIQTDAAINPGNSGGPLVNMYGQVVGINTAKVVITGYEGIGFAIPMAYAENIINELISTGHAPSYAFIGIQYTAITQTQAEYYNVPVGLRIEAIYEQSKIDKNVVQVGDIITEVDGQAIDSTTVLTKILSEKKPGDTIKVKLYRSNRGLGNEYETTITLISSSEVEE